MGLNGFRFLSNLVSPTRTDSAFLYNGRAFFDRAFSLPLIIFLAKALPSSATLASLPGATSSNKSFTMSFCLFICFSWCVNSFLTCGIVLPSLASLGAIILLPVASVGVRVCPNSSDNFLFSIPFESSSGVSSSAKYLSTAFLFPPFLST